MSNGLMVLLVARDEEEVRGYIATASGRHGSVATHEALMGVGSFAERVKVLPGARERSDWPAFVGVLARLISLGIEVDDLAYDEAVRMNQALDTFLREGGNPPDWRPARPIPEDADAH